MCGPALAIVRSCFTQAEKAIHGKPHISRVGILLAVVLPPAHGTQLHCLWHLQGAVPAAGTAEQGTHAWMDANLKTGITLSEAKHDPFIGSKGCVHELPDPQFKTAVEGMEVT